MSLAVRQTSAAASLSASLCHSQNESVERASAIPAASSAAWRRHSGLRMVSTAGDERVAAARRPARRSRSHKPRATVSTASEQAAPAAAALRPLRVMISGAPASGKGTQCELIVQKYGLTHISAGDLLRAEVAAGTEGGRQAKAHMDAGRLVPDEVVVTIVKNRLAQPDAQSKGWLLDGYPRSLSQAHALLALDITPDVFILLDVPQDILVERVVGRRLDPATNRIYHLAFAPPETDEIAARLTQRSDDTEEKVKARLETHNANVASVLDIYASKLVQVNGHRSKDEVFGEIDSLLTRLQQGEVSFD
ncbi:hypothetical protein CLOM_g13973 [Closterium sp. NIES-68]|nr:hypothetical protein CLOM_g13973 [Closterium sp. NIES-68]GJP70464.1 hypothetical protein CLOP_g1407 [Closterium sp. NIES-67]